jgi:hypothetical protein
MKTPAGVPYRLASPCVPITVHLAGFPGVSDDDMRAAVIGAERAWTAQTNACTNLAIAIAFVDGVGPPVGDDGTNVIGARADGWCQTTLDAPPPVEAASPMCNAPSATAATSVFAAADGRITGGDIDLNTLTFAWAALDAQGNPTDRQDLQSVLTHEIGHLIGLDHACWSGIGEHAIDDQGDPVPDCYAAPSAVKADTMFPTIDPGDVSRRALSPEAARAVCALYPAAAGAVPQTTPAAGCPDPGASGCSIAGPPGPRDDVPAVLMAAAALVVGAVARSRRSPSRCVSRSAASQRG